MSATRNTNKDQIFFCNCGSRRATTDDHKCHTCGIYIKWNCTDCNKSMVETSRLPHCKRKQHLENVLLNTAADLDDTQTNKLKKQKTAQLPTIEETETNKLKSQQKESQSKKSIVQLSRFDRIKKKDKNGIRYVYAKDKSPIDFLQERFILAVPYSSIQDIYYIIKNENEGAITYCRIVRTRGNSIAYKTVFNNESEGLTDVYNHLYKKKDIAWTLLTTNGDIPIMGNSFKDKEAVLKSTIQKFLANQLEDRNEKYVGAEIEQLTVEGRRNDKPELHFGELDLSAFSFTSEVPELLPTVETNTTSSSRDDNDKLNELDWDIIIPSEESTWIKAGPGAVEPNYLLEFDFTTEVPELLPTVETNTTSSSRDENDKLKGLDLDMSDNRQHVNYFDSLYNLFSTNGNDKPAPATTPINQDTVNPQNNKL